MVANRGQLLLIGAILFSVVVVGVVIQMNDLQYADSTASDSQTDAIDRAAQTEAETRAALGGLATRVRAGTDDSEFLEAFRKNVSTYQNYSYNMTATGGATYTNVTVNGAASINETVVTQSSGDYRKQTSPRRPDWDLVTDADRVSRFWLNESSVKTGGESFEVVVSNAAGDEWKLRLNGVPVAGPGPDDIDIVVETPSSTNSVCTKSDSSDIDLNLVTGTGSCSFTSFTDVFDGPYTIKFNKGNRVDDGGYEIGVVGGSVKAGNFVGTPDERILYPGIDYQYRSPSIAYNRTFAARDMGS
ncbi:hypothetical protein IL252_10030 [Halomicrobium sp. IBSBa]|uniref:hypothetical protein n=1 Tax=Halomicrobium sp. IBSBa TaxID=2778916 RepID=UPI001ABF2CD8|nr:hypothetical protein [Halomicrobium sp. IBSBa]MBO4248151.1 hypothetical protein [Halomicrobium sp. IBSBa]